MYARLFTLHRSSCTRVTYLQSPASNDGCRCAWSWRLRGDCRPTGWAVQAQSSTVRRRPRWSSVPSNVLARHAVRFSAGVGPVHVDGERHFLQLVRNKRRRSLPETKWRTLIYRLSKVGARDRHRGSVVSEAECIRRVDQRIQCGEDNNLQQDRARRFEGAHATSAHVSDRARSLRAMHRLPRALIEAELE